MELNDLTLGQIQEIKALFASSKPVSSAAGYPYEINKNYIIRTVTMIFTGRLIEVHQFELVLVDVSWIPETDRYMQFVANGSVRECEPYPEGRRVLIGRGAILDAVILEKELPRDQK